MSIDARIASVMLRNDHAIIRLRAIQTSDGEMSIPGREELTVMPPITKIPHAGQQIWGNAGICVVEAGFGGERIEYDRNGIVLRERQP